MQTVAFISDRSHLPGTPDDALAIAALERRGVGVATIAWEDGDVRADLAIIRSPWGYFHALDAFLGWAGRQTTPVANPPAALRWNARKQYLQEISGFIPVIPTVWLAGGADLEGAVRQAAEEWGSGLVLKPTASAGGFQTWRIQGEPTTYAVNAVTAGGSWMLQPYLTAIAEEGEWSLVYFAGVGGMEFSHAVLKRPKAGGFLIHEEHGGRNEGVTPPPALLALVQGWMDALSERLGGLLYARMDVVRDGAGFRLIEAELIEPALYLNRDPHAAEHFADAVLRRISGSSG